MNLVSSSWLAFMVYLWLRSSVHGQEDNSITGPGEGLFAAVQNAFRYPSRTDNIRRQPNFSRSTPFPCRVVSQRANASAYAPARSVHALRPSDITVVGALGDSLVAGNGALEEWALGAFFEDRGVSWCAGGDSTWREVMTLPNILREYNPRITGYSTGQGEYRAPNAHMNIGFPVSSVMDALLQAKILVNRMKRDPRVDFHKDWKMVTVFFGANDICSAECFSKERGSSKSFRRHLQKGLDYLRDHLPRTFVNVVPVIDVTVSVRVKRSAMCHLLHRLFCMCFHRGDYDHVDYLSALTRSYQRAMEDLVNSGRYDTRDDFTVVIQPFIKLFNLPQPRARQLDEVIDISYVSHDCFHFSQKGHALAANLLWNNLLEPVGNKTIVNMKYVMERFLCPSERAPYFFTAKNTKTFFATGHQ